MRPVKRNLVHFTIKQYSQIYSRSDVNEKSIARMLHDLKQQFHGRQNFSQMFTTKEPEEKQYIIPIVSFISNFQIIPCKCPTGMQILQLFWCQDCSRYPGVRGRTPGYL